MNEIKIQSGLEIRGISRDMIIYCDGNKPLSKFKIPSFLEVVRWVALCIIIFERQM